MITKPMLAGKAPADTSLLSYPLLATPKLDGIRCLVINGKAVSRTFKPIPNDHIRKTIEAAFKPGPPCGYTAEFDGEILVRNRTFNELSGDVRRSDGTPDFYFAVFDKVVPPAPGADGGLSEPYSERMWRLKQLSLPDFCEKILPVTINTPEELLAYEEKCIADGYEGVMVRTPGSPYKCGRSSTNEGYLLKVKRFEDAEAEVTGYYELMQNNNVAERDNFGRTKRSSHAENKVGRECLGGLNLRDLKSGVEFSVGTGFDQSTREKLWAARESLIGKVAKYKSQPSGADTKPRFPVWLAWRDSWDMSE